MTDAPDPEAASAADDDHLDEIRQAAGAVVASLKWLVEATERVIDDPGAFSQAVESGKGVVQAFVAGFGDGAADPGDTAHPSGGEESPPES